MFILPPPASDTTAFQPAALFEPLWLPAPEFPQLPVDELHIWRATLDRGRFDSDDCPVSRERASKVRATLFRNDVVRNYANGGDLPSVVTGPTGKLCFQIAECEEVALIAVSRTARQIGLDLERVREDIPFDEMAVEYLDAASQWDLRVTWSTQEKAWKFFRFWTSNEACAQALPSSIHSCRVRTFSPAPSFVAALALHGGPEPVVSYWDWMG